MSISHTMTLSWGSGGSFLSKSVALVSEGENNRDVSVPATTDDMEVDWDVNVARMKSLFILSDQDITINTNSSSVPADTLTPKANKPLIWYDGSGLANPLGTDVSRLFISNAGASAAAVSIRELEDSTP